MKGYLVKSDDVFNGGFRNYKYFETLDEAESFKKQLEKRFKNITIETWVNESIKYKRLDRNTYKLFKNDMMIEFELEYDGWKDKHYVYVNYFKNIQTESQVSLFGNNIEELLKKLNQEDCRINLYILKEMLNIVKMNVKIEFDHII